MTTLTMGNTTLTLINADPIHPLFSLNKLRSIMGLGKEEKKIEDWKKLSSTAELFTTILNKEENHTLQLNLIFTTVDNGNTCETLVSQELLMDYVAWVNPSFRLKEYPAGDKTTLLFYKSTFEDLLDEII